MRHNGRPPPPPSAEEEAAYGELQRNIEGQEADVEAARSEVFAAVNAATALRHALEHATSARTRIAEQLATLDVESNDLRIETERAAEEQASALEALERARQAMEVLSVERAAKESELAGCTGRARQQSGRVPDAREQVGVDNGASGVP